MPRPVHFEIHAADPARAIRFYESVFGWKFSRWGEVEYWLVSTGEGPGIDGGLLPRRGPPPVDGAAVNAWVVTVQVDDVDAYLVKAEKAGARPAVPKTAVGEMGWTAYVKDTEGNIIGLFQPAKQG